MVANKIVHIMISPPDMIETKLVKEAAAILQKDPYETRLLLSGKIPKLIAHYAAVEEADLIANQLKTLGLTTITLDDHELRISAADVFIAHSLQFGEKEIIFRDKANHLTKLEKNDVFLILKGKLPTAADKVVTTTSMKFNLTATLMTGGIPIWQKVKETTRETSAESQYFFRIYSRLSSEPKVEFFENYFNYSCLGSDLTPSSLTNLNGIIAKLRTIFPQALFDDRLAQSSGISGSSDNQARDMELNCRLIYLYRRSVSSPA
jgi:hypothetical protein